MRSRVGKPVVAALLLGGALAAGGDRARAVPLDQAACAQLQVEQSQLILAGVKDSMVQGPEWARANLPPQRLKEIARLIEVEEQLLFRCPRPKTLEEAAAGEEEDGAADIAKSQPAPKPNAAPAKAPAAAPKATTTAPRAADPKAQEKAKAKPKEKAAPPAAPAAAPARKPKANDAYVPPPKAKNADVPRPKANDAYVPPPKVNDAYVPPAKANDAYVPPPKGPAWSGQLQ